MVGVCHSNQGRELLVRFSGNLLTRINHVMVGFFVPRQTGAFVEPVICREHLSQAGGLTLLQVLRPTPGILTKKYRISRFFISPLS
jgi:hypothetical protein